MMMDCVMTSAQSALLASLAQHAWVRHVAESADDVNRPARPVGLAVMIAAAGPASAFLGNRKSGL